MTDWFEQWVCSGDASTLDEFMRAQEERGPQTTDTGRATVYLDGAFWYDETIVSGGRMSIPCPDNKQHSIRVTSAIVTPFGVYDLMREKDFVLYSGTTLEIQWPNPLCTHTMTEA